MTRAPLEIRTGPPASVYPLRQSVLRPEQPIESCHYPGDEAPETVHLSGWSGQELLGIASVYREASPKDSREHAWRLRGMATSESARGTGVGGRLLQRCIEHTRACGGSLIWCNARVPARGFYERHGFVALGESFELPLIGPHIYMHLVLR